jgi:galactitol-specific phosphotransferase system IIB component
MFDFNESWILNGIEDEAKKDQNILSSITQEKEVKSEKKNTAIICVEIDLKKDMAQIESQRMQISNETVTMKEVAEKIFDE